MNSENELLQNLVLPPGGSVVLRLKACWTRESPSWFIPSALTVRIPLENPHVKQNQLQFLLKLQLPTDGSVCLDSKNRCQAFSPPLEDIR